MKTHHLVRSFFALIVGAQLAACSSHSSFSPSATSTQSVTEMNAFAPPACTGQTTTAKFASVKDTLGTSGGHACIPAFANFGGSLSYPAANPSIKATLTSSTTNYNGKLPNLHTGAPLFYLQVAASAATRFGSTLPTGGGLVGPSIITGQTYTLYAQATVSGVTKKSTPCFAVASTGGVIGNVGSALKGQSVPAGTMGLIEVYRGKSAASKC